MFDALLVLGADVGLDLLIVVVVVGSERLVEVDAREEGVLGHDLVQDVEIQGELVDGLDALQHFAAERALDLVVSEEVREAMRAECVATAHDDARDAGADVVLLPAKVTVVQAAGLVVGTHPWGLLRRMSDG